jgi:hypothetical protein
MLGSAFNPAHHYDRNPAGLQGPRGCDPLAWAPRQRLARSMPDWYPPRMSQYNPAAGVITQIAKLNEHRALLTITVEITTSAPGVGQVLLSPIRDRLNPPRMWVKQVSSRPVGISTTLTNDDHFQFTYVRDGATTTWEWFALFLGQGSATINVLEAEYYG